MKSGKSFFFSRDESYSLIKFKIGLIEIYGFKGDYILNGVFKREDVNSI